MHVCMRGGGASVCMFNNLFDNIIFGQLYILYIFDNYPSEGLSSVLTFSILNQTKLLV